MDDSFVHRLVCDNHFRLCNAKKSLAGWSMAMSRTEAGAYDVGKEAEDWVCSVW